MEQVNGYVSGIDWTRNNASAWKAVGIIEAVANMELAGIAQSAVLNALDTIMDALK